MAAPDLRVSMAGTGALLLDAGSDRFEPAVQERLWAAARRALERPWVTEAVPGMNNLLVSFDPMRTSWEAAERDVRELWPTTEPAGTESRLFEFPVAYGGADGEDLPALARGAGLTVEEVVRRHAAATYRVGAIGSMPGFPYLFGLDPALACKRRSTPRILVQAGSVIIGGVQAGIQPCDAPSGWHIIGRTAARLFDLETDPPCLLRPGDTVRFSVAGLSA